MTSLSITRVTSRPRVPGRPHARVSTKATVGVAVVSLSASLVFVAAGVVLLSAFADATGDAIDVIGALVFGAIAIAAVVEAIRLARPTSQPPAT